MPHTVGPTAYFNLSVSCVILDLSGKHEDCSIDISFHRNDTAHAYALHLSQMFHLFVRLKTSLNSFHISQTILCEVVVGGQ